MLRALQKKSFSLTYVVGGNITHRNMQKKTWVTRLVLEIWGILCDPVKKGLCNYWRYFKLAPVPMTRNAFVRVWLISYLLTRILAHAESRKREFTP